MHITPSIRTTGTTLASILLIMTVAACGGNQSTPTPTAASDSSISSPRAAETPTSEPVSASGNAGTTNSDALNITGIGNELSTLQSFRSRFKLTFDGKDANDKANAGSTEIVQEVIRDKSVHSKWTSQTRGDAPSSLETYQVGTTSYMLSDKDGKMQCIIFSSDDNKLNQKPAFSPGDVMGSVSNARLVTKGETINGVLANHYSGGSQTGLFGASSSQKGDIWVAQVGSYVVKYVVQTSGKNPSAQNGDTREVNIRWEYNVEDANKVADLTLPKVCEDNKSADDVPMPPNATDKAVIAGTRSFKSPDKVAAVTTFMKQALTDAGWVAGSATLATDDGAMLSFTKDSRALQVIVAKNSGGGTQVVISESKPQ